MKARLRADLRIYIGYIETSNEEYNGLELLLLNNKLISVYSIDLDVEKE